MNLTINGEQAKVEAENVTIDRLLVLKKVDMPDMVSVQLNGTFVNRAAFESTSVHDGDEVDFLYFMGGGGRV
jgi:sulfur carrier protein